MQPSCRLWPKQPVLNCAPKAESKPHYVWLRATEGAVPEQKQDSGSRKATLGDRWFLSFEISRKKSIPEPQTCCSTDLEGREKKTKLPFWQMELAFKKMGELTSTWLATNCQRWLLWNIYQRMHTRVKRCAGSRGQASLKTSLSPGGGVAIWKGHPKQLNSEQ